MAEAKVAMSTRIEPNIYNMLKDRYPDARSDSERLLLCVKEVLEVKE